MSSSDPFQELVDSLKRVLLHPSSSPVCPLLHLHNPAQHPALLLRSFSPVPWPDQRPSLVRRRSAMASYYKFLSPLTCIHRCFPLTNLKSPFIFPFLSGSALQWAEMILNQAGPATQSFSHFIAHFWEVFSSSPGILPWENNCFVYARARCPYTNIPSSSEPWRLPADGMSRTS